MVWHETTRNGKTGEPGLPTVYSRRGKQAGVAISTLEAA
jgi:hypothetical protein